MVWTSNIFCNVVISHKLDNDVKIHIQIGASNLIRKKKSPMLTKIFHLTSSLLILAVIQLHIQVHKKWTYFSPQLVWRHLWMLHRWNGWSSQPFQNVNKICWRNYECRTINWMWSNWKIVLYNKQWRANKDQRWKKAQKWAQCEIYFPAWPTVLLNILLLPTTFPIWYFNWNELKWVYWLL